MQTIGERLLDARQRRGVSIREAAEATKVRGDYLAAMEANQFDNIPLAEVYRRGFLKIYARFLRLDSDRIVGDYNALLAARNPHLVRSRRATDFVEPARTIEPREPEAMDEFATGAIEIAERPDNRRKTILIGIGGVCALVVLGFAVKSLFSGGAATEPMAPVATAVAVAEGEVILTARSAQPMAVKITRNSDNAVVFDQTLVPNRPVPFKGVGDFTVIASPLQKLNVRVNGQEFAAYAAGYSKGPLHVESPKGR